MKLGKKLLIATLSAALLFSTTTASTQKPQEAERTILADGSKQPSNYDDDNNITIKRPTSIHTTKAI